MRVLIRTSKWAIWARRLGSFAVPLTILPIFLHREQLIASSDFLVIAALAALLAGLAVFLAAGAYVRLWTTGDQGWGKATWGLVFGLLSLLPVGYLALEASRYPYLPEITTDIAAPLPLTTPIAVPPMVLALREVAATTFPNARTRSYPVEATDMFVILANLVTERGWEIRSRRAPATALDAGRLNAIAVTLFGFRDEIVLRVAGSADGSTVDMRSVALSGFHDFGSNGRRIEEFLLALDRRITEELRNVPEAPAELDPADE